MEATRVRSASSGFGQSWRDLARTPTHQVPIVLGGVLAVLVGVLTYLFEAVEAGAVIAATPTVAYLVIFGIIGLIGYGVSKENIQNGSLVAAIAGLALLAMVGSATEGLLTGFLLLAGAVWSLASTR
jgi:hypothetical protein